MIHSIVGRSSDLIVSPGGKLLHGEFFTHLFYKIEGVYQFRVVQETSTDLKAQIVPGPRFNKQVALPFLDETIRREGDPKFRIRFELADFLPPAPSGKYRFTISHVPFIHDKT